MRLWLFIFVLAVAVAFGAFIRQDPGYAFFTYGNWSVELPLWMCAIIVFLTITATIFILWILNLVFSGPKRLHEWWQKHQESKARQQTTRGLLALAEGRWIQAERYLIQGAPHNDSSIINYLSAAKAAQENGSTEKCNQYLQWALQKNGDSIAVRLTQIQLQIKQGDIQNALKNIQSLHKDAPKNAKILRILSYLYETTQDWQSLYTLLPTLHKTEALPQEILKKLEQTIYLHLLTFYGEEGPKFLVGFWEKMPSSFQKDPKIVHHYAELLLKNSLEDVSETLIRTTLKFHWDNALILLYGLIKSHSIKKQLAFAESLLPEHLNNPILLLTVGRLCLYENLWGKARSYLEQSLAQEPFVETYAELGQLMDELGQTDKRDHYFKKGLIEAKNLKRLCLSKEDSLD